MLEVKVECIINNSHTIITRVVRNSNRDRIQMQRDSKVIRDYKEKNKGGLTMLNLYLSGMKKFISLKKFLLREFDKSYNIYKLIYNMRLL